ncbi:helix-turn-helix domain-containing protein [Algoriphagus aquimarinus]|uniref:winged helix-turn-helix transcriptional regulator n=1 Tax=Algoriphagus aquimarinus TaxID=237018 RepID=UPI0030D75376|tara:strand:- start:130206 stop:130553 length:348 start_codon:yes stop_codon:yes gene_type:complete
MSELENIELTCPSDAFLKVIKGKCKTTLIVMIKKRRNRFSEMKRTLPTISERSIAKQLDELEKDGVITRKVFPEVPPRVEYYLSEYGESLYPIVREMRKWGYLHLEKQEKVDGEK